MANADHPKLRSLLNRIQHNDEYVKCIHFSCTELGIQEEQRKGSNFNSFQFYIGVLSLALSKNTFLETVYIDPEFLFLLNKKSRQYLVNAITNIPNLKHLKVFAYTHKELNVTLLTKLLQSSFNLESLELHNTTLFGTKEEFSLLSDALLVLSCTTLKKFACSQLKFPDFFTLNHLLSKSILSLSSKSSLEDIRISGGEKGENRSISTVTLQRLSKMPFLRILSLIGLRLGPDNLSSIVDLLTRPDSKLESLNLSNNRINDKGCIIIASALLNSSSSNNGGRIQDLILANNKLGIESGAVLRKVVQKCATMKTLNLNYNCIGNDGILEIATALRSNNSLQNLQLSNCMFDDVGFQCIAGALQKNKKLCQLNLKFNSVKACATSYGAMIDALENNFALQRLTLNSDVPEDMLRKIKFYCKMNASSLRRDLYENPKKISIDRLVNLLGERQEQRQKTSLQIKSTRSDADEYHLQKKSSNPLGWFGGVKTSVTNAFRHPVDNKNSGSACFHDDATELSQLFYLIRSKPELVCVCFL